MRADDERLRDIREAIERIDKYANKGRDSFETDELIQTWLVHHLKIIGEACRALSPEFKRRHADVPWSKIIGMRYILVHHYFGIDSEAVWQAVVNELPDLRQKVEHILSQSEEEQA